MGALNYKTRRNRRHRLAAELYATWTPRRLFTFGTSVGWAHWYDSPSDYPGGNHPYLYQDSAGTTPVTAVGQSVGLILDRAYGGMRGSEMASAGYATPATYDNVTTVVSATAFTQTVGTTLGRSYLNLTTVVGKTYEVSSSITTTDASGILLYARALPGGTGTILATSPAIASGGTARAIFTATTTTSSVLWSTQTVARIVNGSAITIREIPGVHRIQAPAASRAVLSALVNQVPCSEDFSNALWAKQRSSITSNAAIAPDGTMTADKLVADTTVGTTHRIYPGPITLPAASSVVCTCAFKAAEYGFGGIRFSTAGETKAATVCMNLATGEILPPTAIDYTNQSAWSVNLGNGWFRLFLRATMPVGETLVTPIIYVADSLTNNDTFTGNNVDGIYIWGADFRTEDDAAKNLPPYQRTGSSPSTDHDTDGFPFYLKYDGTDDFYQSAANVDGSVSDKVSVVTGVTKLSAAALAILVEHTSSVGANNGSFGMYGPEAASSTFAWISKGTVFRTSTASGYAAPKSCVLMGVGDIGGDSSQCIVDAVPAAPNLSDQGSGSYTNALMYWGARGGTSNRFSGREYASIGRFGAMSDTERNRLGAWVKNLMRLP